MAYGDRVDQKSRAASIVMMGALVFLVIWGLAVGLNVSVVKKIAEKLDVVDVVEEVPPPEEPPPPPPEKLPPPPPVVIPKPPISIPTPNVLRDTVRTPPPVYVPTPVITPPAPPRPPAPPPPPAVDKSKGISQSGARGLPTNADYPSAAVRSEAEGTTRFRVNVGPDGRVTSCSVTGSSGNSALDSTTCSLLERRARFKPALDKAGNPTSGSWSSSVRWVLN